MNKFLAFFLVLVLGLTITSPASAIFAFPSIKPFPFPSKTPKPTGTPSPSSTPTTTPTATPTPTPVPTKLEILDIDPSSANFMQEFVIKGTKFGTTPGGIGFRYYNQSFLSGGAPIISWSDTEIRAKVPAVKKGSYRISVVTSNNEKSNEVKFTVKNGQPIVNSSSIRLLNGEYELVFQGTEFGSSRGSVDIYVGQDLVGHGVIEYWSSSRIRFTLPDIPNQEYGFQVTTKDGRQSSFKFFIVGN